MNKFSKNVLGLAISSTIFPISTQAEEMTVPLVIYEHGNFGGNSVEINQDTSIISGMNDSMSSFQIKPGYTVKFYEHGNYQGQEFIRDSNSQDNSFPSEFNDMISSVKIIKNETYYSAKADPGSPILTIWEDGNFQGSYLTQDFPGNMILSYGALNNNISSYKILPGYTVYFYDNNENDTPIIRDSNSPDGAMLTELNDQISFLRIEEGQIDADTKIVLYQDSKFKGAKVEIKESTSMLPQLNDDMSSYWIRPGYSVEFFEHGNYSGKKYVRNDKSSDKGFVAEFNDQISSLIIREGGPALTIYENFDYGGDSLEIFESVQFLGSEWGDRMSSFKINEGYQVTFYADPSYQGQGWTRDKLSTDSHKSSSFNDIISSVKVEKSADVQEKDPVTLYTGTYHSGTKYGMTKTNPFIKDFNDKMQSFKIKPGKIVRFFTDGYYSGDYFTRNSASLDSADPAFKNAISSIQIGNESHTFLRMQDGHVPVHNILTIYEGENYFGAQMQISSNTRDLGYMNDHMSSYRISKGYKVIFYEHGDYKGRKWTRTYHNGYFVPKVDFDNMISSIKVFTYNL